MWSLQDSNALAGIFEFAFKCFTTKFYVLGVETDFWTLCLACFFFLAVFRILAYLSE